MNTPRLPDSLFPPPSVSAWGNDAYGRWIKIEIGRQIQCLRWIEPGEFWMGALENEPEREEREVPRHLVRLTQGFWLADTACTQALWQEVMSNNPSKFSVDLQNPVERVSWGDVQRFLTKITEQLPGLRASLPTEAEWEYACRAGTETIFHFGDEIMPDLANYYESHRGSPNGERICNTVPVKHYAPNAWGLYQMHGNVSEWCADGIRDYDGTPQIDPRGPEGQEDFRVVRGGAYCVLSSGLRAACRSGVPQDETLYFLGFRFSLRVSG